MFVMVVRMMMMTWGMICLLMKTWTYRQSELSGAFNHYTMFVISPIVE